MSKHDMDFMGFEDEDCAAAFGSALAMCDVEFERFEYNGWHFIGFENSPVGHAARAGVIACIAGKHGYLLTPSDPRTE